MRFRLQGAVWLCFACGCSGPYSNPSVSAKESEKVVEVRLHRVQLQAIPEIITATGELMAEDLAVISVKAPGRLARLNVDLGTRVRQGDTLAELEREDYEFRVRQAEAMVEQTRARLGLRPGGGDQVHPEQTSAVREAAAKLEEARNNHKRFTALVEQGILSRLEETRVTAALRVAEAQHQAAIEEVYQALAQLAERNAQLALARQQLQDTVVRAPFAGAITRRHATVGEYLPVNAPVAALVRESPIRLRLEVPERLASKVRLGQRMDVRFESFPMHSGRVVRLSPMIESQNRSLLVEGEFRNESGILRPGAFAEGTVVVDEQARGLAIPESALLSFAGVDRVFVADNGRLAERVVKLGRKLPAGLVQVMAGLSPGERVAAQASDRLSSGRKITETR